MAKLEVQAKEITNPTIPTSDLAPVEKQQALHDAAVNENKPALLPGCSQIAVGDTLMSQIAFYIHKAELEGKRHLAADLRNVRVRIGELLIHVDRLEKEAVGEVKSIFKKIGAFFKK